MLLAIVVIVSVDGEVGGGGHALHLDCAVKIRGVGVLGVESDCHDVVFRRLGRGNLKKRIRPNGQWPRLRRPRRQHKSTERRECYISAELRETVIRHRVHVHVHAIRNHIY